LNAALQGAIPTKAKPYEKVSALLFHWEDDDMGVDGLESELGDVLRNTYGFTVERFIIPSSSTRIATRKTNLRLNEFIKDHDGKTHLLIYVYSEHATNKHNHILLR
jgi:hypothetical protein